MASFCRIAHPAVTHLWETAAAIQSPRPPSPAEFDRLASDDPDRAEHLAQLAAALPALQVLRAMEDVEIG